MKFMFSLCLILLASNLLNAQISNLNWQQTALKIDGNNKDWMERPGFFDSESGVLYEAYNDSNSLYMLFEITNYKTQRKAMDSGFTLEFSYKAKPKFNASITLPVMHGGKNFNQDEPFVDGNFEGKSRPEFGSDFEPNFRNEYLLLNAYAELSGFMGNSSAIYPFDSIHAFTYGIGWDEKGSMLYEFQIPLMNLFGNAYRLIELSNTELTIKPIFKGIDKPDANGHGDFSMQGAGMGVGGARQGGGGERPEGGGHGEMRGPHGGMENMQALSKSNSFKYRVKLALKP